MIVLIVVLFIAALYIWYRRKQAQRSKQNEMPVSSNAKQHPGVPSVAYYVPMHDTHAKLSCVAPVLPPTKIAEDTEQHISTA